MTTYLVRGTAVIIGGSLAGLITARVLADHFEQVLIIERDRYPDAPVARSGVPQSHQWHGIMARGYHALQRLYPELTERLAAHGVPLPDTLKEYIVYSTGGVGYLPRWKSDITIPVCSRPVLEWHIRQLTQIRPSIHTIQQCEVTGLVLNRVGTSVSRVQLRYRSGATQSGCDTIPAAFVVDASGRNSRSGQWLQDVGFAPPKESGRETAVHYVNHLFHAPPKFAPDWNGLIVAMQYPQNPRFGGMRLIEDNLLQVSLAGLNGLRPPTDADGFHAYARALASPIIYRAMAGLEPAGTPHAFHVPQTRRRHYERMARCPDRFLAIGDAHCAYNPLYGQGVTSLAMCGEYLLDALPRYLTRYGRIDGFSTRAFKKTAKIIDMMWRQANQLDTLWANPEPALWSWKERIMNRLSKETMVVLMADETSFLRATQVRHLLKPPWYAATPKVVGKLLWQLMWESTARDLPIEHPIIHIAAQPLQE